MDTQKDIDRTTEILIIGSGPAAYSAALYASRGGKETLVISGSTRGGLITTTDIIDNYLGLPGVSGMDMSKSFEEHALKFGAEITSGEVISCVKEDNYFITELDNGEVVKSTVVIYSTGSDPRKLNLPNEDISGVSYCATCDGIFYEDEKVVVVGGGETAVEEALYLAEITESVDILVRGASFRATQPAVDKLYNHPKVTVHMISSIAKILDDGDDNLIGVSLLDGTRIEASGLFVAIGQVPNSKIAKDNNHVHTFDDGFINESVTPGFFSAGDVTDSKYRQVVIAAGDGAKAAIDAISYINNL